MLLWRTDYACPSLAEALGSTTILGITTISNPLPANSVSVTLPGLNLNTGTQYLNLTVACWPSGFSSLVSRHPRSPGRDGHQCPLRFRDPDICLHGDSGGEELTVRLKALEAIGRTPEYDNPCSLEARHYLAQWMFPLPGRDTQHGTA